MTTIELDHLLTYAREKNIGLTSLHTLLTIAEEPAPLSFISQQVGITTACMTGIADRLTALGMVHRTTGHGDRRRVKLQLTAKGQDLITSALLGPALV